MDKSSVPEIVAKEIGRSALRREDPAALSGRAAYIADLAFPDVLHVSILRSPFAHARITAIDVSAARAHGGVVQVWTGADVLPRCGGVMARMELPGFVPTVQPIGTPGVPCTPSRCAVSVTALRVSGSTSRPRPM